MSEWRDSRPKDCGLCGRQWPAERFDLVERVISAEKRAAVAERALREQMEHPEDRGLVLALQARIVELEEIVAKQNAKRMGKGAA